MFRCTHRSSFRLLRTPQAQERCQRFFTSNKNKLNQLAGVAAPQSSTAGLAEHAVSDSIPGEQPESSRSSPDRRRIVFSGIQPTGVPHLGNYIGALRQWKNYHEESSDPNVTSRCSPEQYFSIVDLHALTASMPKEERKQLRKESFASLLAIGLRNTGTTSVFFQSDVSQTAFDMVRLLKARRSPIIASSCGF